MSGRKRRLAIAHALEGLSAHAIREWQTRLAAGLPLNMSLESAALLSKTAAQLEEQALGPEKDRRYTKIVVTIGEYPTEQAYENELRRSDAPAASSYDTFPDETLNADARGEIVPRRPASAVELVGPRARLTVDHLGKVTTFQRRVEWLSHFPGAHFGSISRDHRPFTRSQIGKGSKSPSPQVEGAGPPPYYLGKASKG